MFAREVAESKIEANSQFGAYSIAVDLQKEIGKRKDDEQGPEDWKAVAHERAEIIQRMADAAWFALYGGEGEEEWQNPMQAIVRLIDAYRVGLGGAPAVTAAEHTKVVLMLPVINTRLAELEKRMDAVEMQTATVGQREEWMSLIETPPTQE